VLFNIDKCKVLHLGFNIPQTNYVMEATQLQSVSEERERLGNNNVSPDLK